MSTSDDRRIEEGGVIKQDAFDAVIALFEDEEWIKQLMRDWQVQNNWMLPSENKPQLMDKDDKDSSLNQVAQAVKMKKERRAAKAATIASSTASTSDPASTSSSNTSVPVSGSAPASADKSALASASDPTSTPPVNLSAPASGSDSVGNLLATGSTVSLSNSPSDTLSDNTQVPRSNLSTSVSNQERSLDTSNPTPLGTVTNTAASIKPVSTASVSSATDMVTKPTSGSKVRYESLQV
ncbi:hypothetical protein K435DRAFT_862918 [Dendrothele bispora CBS 962.96]|uniref:Uncharacterized protein n=1 Tax=Dendrothele bispora (strain CBS 962.96) TaxID=1314807 RepID=A0A4S8LRY0_DENBC|nr:hypothetical protein K435DRAFT_862918 [Dendrothele bispora CBS 962.96]